MENPIAQSANGATHPHAGFPSFPSFPATSPQINMPVTVPLGGQSAPVAHQEPDKTGWFNDPAQHTDAERAYVRRFTAEVLRSEDAAERIRRVVVDQIVPAARTRKQAISMLCRLYGVKPLTAMAYMRGLRLVRLLGHQQGGPRDSRRGVKKSRSGKEGLRAGTKTGRFAAKRTMESKPGPGTTGRAKPESQLRAEQALQRTMAQELMVVERILMDWRSLSANGRAWVLGGLNTEMGRALIGGSK